MGRKVNKKIDLSITNIVNRVGSIDAVSRHAPHYTPMCGSVVFVEKCGDDHSLLWFLWRNMEKTLDFCGFCGEDHRCLWFLRLNSKIWTWT